MFPGLKIECFSRGDFTSNNLDGKTNLCFDLTSIT